jgi:mannose/fructose/N-acetylgalactosamine-specific phosphotransferase system component IIC
LSWLTTLFKDVEGWFTSPKAQAAEATIASLLPTAMTIVQEINSLAPNRTLTEINAIATKYALPAVTALQSGQTTGNVLLNLGTEILAKNHAPGAATSLLNTVIQLAVTATGTQTTA